MTTSKKPHMSLFFFNDTATTEIYTLSLHDALPISSRSCLRDPRRRASTTGPGRDPLWRARSRPRWSAAGRRLRSPNSRSRSEEHTSELQSHSDLVCRLLLVKKKNDIESPVKLRHHV